jgi:AhpD family alkylhydroperoxidase
MMNHSRNWLIAIISIIAVLSLPLTIALSQSESSGKMELSSGDSNYPEIRAKVLQNMGKFEQKYPDAMNGFYSLHQAVMDSGALNVKTKELITLGIAVSKGCDGCIAFHTHASIEAGATEEEIMEVLGVALYMGGGPSLTYATHVIEALEQFKAVTK